MRALTETIQADQLGDADAAPPSIFPPFTVLLLISGFIFFLHDVTRVPASVHCILALIVLIAPHSAVGDPWRSRYLTGTHSRSTFKACFHILPPFLPLTRPYHDADSGEASELMPGGIADILLQPYLTCHPSVSRHSERMEKLCFLIFGTVEVSTYCIHSITVHLASYTSSHVLYAISPSLLPQCNTVPEFLLFYTHVPAQASVCGEVQVWGYLLLPPVASISRHTNGRITQADFVLVVTWKALQRS